MGQYEKMAAGLEEGNAYELSPELASHYRHTFSGSLGQKVLADLLANLGLFEVIRDEGDMHRHNHAIGILNSIGVIKRNPDGGVENTERIVNALMGIIAKEN